MKQFFVTLAAVLIGGFLALLVYDRLIVAPRQSAADAQRHRADLSQARADAREVAAEVEASVQRSVDGARQAMDAQAKDMDRRALLTEAAGRATMFRVSLTDYYQSHGRWPRDPSEVGLPSPDDLQGGAARAIAVDGNGVVTLTLDERFQPRSTMVLTPRTNTATGMVEWDCAIEGDPLMRQVLTRCKVR
jgi:Pilin (bacterial filament)